jgi:hypothetical protein
VGVRFAWLGCRTVNSTAWNAGHCRRWMRIPKDMMRKRASFIRDKRWRTQWTRSEAMVCLQQWIIAQETCWFVYSRLIEVMNAPAKSIRYGAVEMRMVHRNQSIIEANS